MVCASRIRTIAKLKRDAESGTEGKRRVGRRRKKKHLLCHTGVPRRVRRPVTHTPPSPVKMQDSTRLKYSRTCPDCSGADFVEDQAAGDLICTVC